MDSTDQRRHPRVNVDFFADWGWGPECEYYDRVTSMSISGCFLATRRELNRGDEIYLRLKTEAAGAINVKGAVRHQLRVMYGAPLAGVGVEFVGLSADALATLQKMMNFFMQPA